jgi:hypothetical protein
MCREYKMVTAKEIVGLISREKWLAYFLLFWAGAFIVWAIYGFTWGIDGGSASGILDILVRLIDLAAGGVLALLGLKFLGKNLIPSISGERLFVYFVLLWAATFVFGGLSGIIYYLGHMTEYWQYAISIISSLFDLAAGAVLALFGMQLLGSKDPVLQPSQ